MINRVCSLVGWLVHSCVRERVFVNLLTSSWFGCGCMINISAVPQALGQHVSCHSQDYKLLLSTYESSSIASTRTFTFTVAVS